jgi:hypothetical protein
MNEVSTADLLDHGRIVIVAFEDEIGLRVTNEEFTALVFMTSGQAEEVARLLVRASSKVDYPEISDLFEIRDITRRTDVLPRAPRPEDRRS